MSDLARRGGEIDRPKDPGKRDALALLPEDWRLAARFFFGFHSDILKGTTGIATRLRMWMEDDDVKLTLDEAKAAMRKLTKPARCAAFQYAGQLLAALAEEVAAVVQKRREREAAEDFRRRQTANAKGADPAKVKDLLRTFGKIGE